MSPREEYLAYITGAQRLDQAWVFINEVLAELEKEAGPARKPDALRYLIGRFGLLQGYLKEERMCETLAPGPRPWHAYGTPGLTEIRERAEKAMDKILTLRGFDRLRGPDLLPAEASTMGIMAEIYAGRRDR